MLLNKVVVGKGCKMKTDNTTLTAPPAGFDSVSVIPLIIGMRGNDEEPGPR